MIVDTSAFVAVMTGEPEREDLIRQMRAAPRLRMSVGSYLECSIVIDGRGDPVLSRQLDALLDALGVELAPIDAEQVRAARRAYADFGRRSGHPARLNFGDCFAYALATTLDEPLLFKGDDFTHTDVRVSSDNPGGAAPG